MIYELKHPIEFGGKEITELNFREKIKVKDIKDCGHGQLTPYEIMMVAGNLAAKPDLLMDEIEWEDMQEIIPIVTGFLAGKDSATDGKAPSP